MARGLSFLKLPAGPFGGSVDLVMVPLIVYAWRWGCGWGVLVGFAFGLLKFFLAGGSALNWQSLLLDYAVAYAFVGFAGVMKKVKWGLPVGALIGCVGRFVIHFLSGVTIYAQYAEAVTDFFGVSVNTPNAVLYSLVYNAAYMLPNTILAIAVCGLLLGPLQKIKKA